MPTFVLEHLNAFPEWYRVLLLSVWGTLLVLVPIYSILQYREDLAESAYAFTISSNS